MLSNLYNIMIVEKVKIRIKQNLILYTQNVVPTYNNNKHSVITISLLSISVSVGKSNLYKIYDSIFTIFYVPGDMCIAINVSKQVCSRSVPSRFTNLKWWDNL